MAGDEDTGALPEEPAEAKRRDELAWDELAATLRTLDLLDPRTPVERARDAIRKGAEMLRRDEPETADKVIAAIGFGRPRGQPRQYTEDEDFRLVCDIYDLVERDGSLSLKAAAERLAGKEPYKSGGQSVNAIRVRFGRCLLRVLAKQGGPAGSKPATTSEIINAVQRLARDRES
jgi:hypothetical protein